MDTRGIPGEGIGDATLDLKVYSQKQSKRAKAFITQAVRIVLKNAISNLPQKCEVLPVVTDLLIFDTRKVVLKWDFSSTNKQ